MNRAESDLLSSLAHFLKEIGHPALVVRHRAEPAGVASRAPAQGCPPPGRNRRPSPGSRQLPRTRLPWRGRFREKSSRPPRLPERRPPRLARRCELPCPRESVCTLEACEGFALASSTLIGGRSSVKLSSLRGAGRRIRIAKVGLSTEPGPNGVFSHQRSELGLRKPGFADPAEHSRLLGQRVIRSK